MCVCVSGSPACRSKCLSASPSVCLRHSWEMLGWNHFSLLELKTNTRQRSSFCSLKGNTLGCWIKCVCFLSVPFVGFIYLIPDCSAEFPRGVTTICRLILDSFRGFKALIHIFIRTMDQVTKCAWERETYRVHWVFYPLWTHYFSLVSHLYIFILFYRPVNQNACKLTLHVIRFALRGEA